MSLWMPEFLQAKKYTAQRLRMLYGNRPMQSGIAGRGFATVTGSLAAEGLRPQAVSPLPSMNVLIGPGAAWIRGGYNTGQGMYHIVNDANMLVPIEFNPSSVSRIDQVILRVYDEVDAPNDTTAATLEVLKGTPDPAADLNLLNRAGAVAELPPSSVRLCDVQVDPGVTAIENLSGHDIKDRRPAAFGRYHRSIRTSGTAWFMALDDTNLLPTSFELASGWLSIKIHATIHSDAAPSVGSIKALMDVPYDADERQVTINLTNEGVSADLEWIFPYAAGNYRPGVWCSLVSGGSITVFDTVIELRELLRNPTTTNDLV